MQLATPFIRIPLDFDAARLAVEVAQFDTREWRPHPQGHPGNSAIPFLAVNGNVDDEGVAGPMRPTTFLARCPYVRQVLASLEAPLGRTRLMKLDARAEATAHVDINYYWQQRVRVHIPVVTFPEVEFICGEASTHMKAGECWIFDTWRMHNVLNPAERERIHLVVDTVGSDAFWSSTEGTQSPRAIPYRPGFEPALSCESTNLPIVMTPWEIDSLWSHWLADACAGPADPNEIAAINTAVQPIFRAWRSLWAEYGDRPAGWPRYVQLMTRLGEVARQFAGRVPLPNGMDVARMLDHSLLRAVHTPELASGERAIRHIPDLGQTGIDPVLRAAGSNAIRPPVTPSIADRSPTQFDRPLIILGAPRSGSSLLFETLVQSPDLVTVGGESHLQFETIAALHPANRGFDSNRLDRRDATAEIIAGLHRGFTAALRDRDGRPGMPGASRLLEKTPKNALRLPLLDAVFPDALYVYLYRDPRANLGSLIEGWESGRFVTYPHLPGWTGPPWSYLLVPGWRDLTGLPLCAIVAEQWRRTQEVLLADFAAIPARRIFALDYDEFVADPARHVAGICAFAGIGWDRALAPELPLSRHTVSPPRPDKWRRREAEIAPHLSRIHAVDERARAFVASTRARMHAAAVPAM